MQTPLLMPASAGMIAAHLGRRTDQIQKIVSRLGLQPVARYGIVRAFDQAAYDAIVKDLERIEAVHHRRRRQAAPSTDQDVSSQLATA